MAKVFVVQVPARRDGPRGGWVEKYDLSPAEHFGELVRVLPYGNVPDDPTATRAKLFDAFRTFDRSKDFVLLLGDPVAIAQAVSVLTVHLKQHPFRVLKWDRHTSQYFPYIVG